jgi:urease accessory protein
MTERARRSVAPCLWLALQATVASAHTGTGLPGGIAQGFAHPFGGLDHLLAMVSVGLWGAFLGRPLIYALPVVFPVVMVVGAALGMFGVTLPRVEVGIALSVLALGTCIATAWRAPVIVASFVVAVFAMFHGYAHGRELPSAADPVGYSVGFVLATGLLHLVGVGIGALADRSRATRFVRAMGVAIACAGLVFLYESLLERTAFDVALAVPLLVAAPVAAAVTLFAARPNAARRPIAPKVLAAWLIAVALLAALLRFVPVTPGYLPDHLE